MDLLCFLYLKTFKHPVIGSKTLLAKTPSGPPEMSLIAHSSEADGAIHIVTLNRPDASPGFDQDVFVLFKDYFLL